MIFFKERCWLLLLFLIINRRKNADYPENLFYAFCFAVRQSFPLDLMTSLNMGGFLRACGVGTKGFWWHANQASTNTLNTKKVTLNVSRFQSETANVTSLREWVLLYLNSPSPMTVLIKICVSIVLDALAKGYIYTGHQMMSPHALKWKQDRPKCAFHGVCDD